MDYKKAYEEALAIARKLQSGEEVSALPGMTVYELMFPELKESEDEIIRNRIICYLKQDIEEYPERKERIKGMLAWLEKQESKEWSEEDEENFVWFDKLFRAESVVLNGRDIPQDKYQWFKSLRPQNHWKPSDEQMEALKHIADGWAASDSERMNINALYNDLQKL